MKWWKSAGFLFALSLILGACSGNQAPVSLTVPVFDMECVSSQSSNCSALGHSKTFRVGILQGTSSISCSATILLAGSDFFSGFILSGATTSEFTGTLLRGSVTSWVDSSNTETTSLPSGPYTICSYLDVDEDGLLDSGEPLSTAFVNTLGINQFLQDWSPAP